MKMRVMFASFVFISTICVFSASLSFSQEIPKPGTVIDKTNYKAYAHLWPHEMLPLFEDGFGLQKPISIKVRETKSYPLPTGFVALSARNKGKYSLDKNGNIVGGWQREGLPFPDLNRDDKDFVNKLMWNYEARYVADDELLDDYTFVQRKGEPLRYNHVVYSWIRFFDRIVTPPKPVYKTPVGLQKVVLIAYLEPSILKDTKTLSYRYADLSKSDDVYIYLPSMRRVLRGDAGQRSTPVMGIVSALDDFAVFDGRTPEFTYKLVGEQKILGVKETTLVPSVVRAKGWPPKEFPYPTDNWEATDVYVIDIFPKDPKYPQSKKRIWMDKENYKIYHAVAWDRSGKFWKFWTMAYELLPVKGDLPTLVESCYQGVDVQFGMNTITTSGSKINVGLKYENYTPAALARTSK